MPLYHFNVYNGTARMDRRGSELADHDEARNAMIDVACDLLHAEAERIYLGEQWRVEATDEQGTILFRIDIAMSAAAATI
jgi:hypothetical protein